MIKFDESKITLVKFLKILNKQEIKTIIVQDLFGDKRLITVYFDFEEKNEGMCLNIRLTKKGYEVGLKDFYSFLQSGYYKTGKKGDPRSHK